MIEKRKAQRRSTNLNIEFKVAEIEFGEATWVMAKGIILDISDKGFGIITSHPLQRGQVIMIKKSENTKIPLFGLVKWTKEQNDFYRVGLGYRYIDNA
jgi:hypothetical protein